MPRVRIFQKFDRKNITIKVQTVAKLRGQKCAEPTSSEVLSHLRGWITERKEKNLNASHSWTQGRKTKATKKRGEQRLDAQVDPGSSGGGSEHQRGGERKKRSPSEGYKR